MAIAPVAPFPQCALLRFQVGTKKKIGNVFSSSTRGCLRQREVAPIEQRQNLENDFLLGGCFVEIAARVIRRENLPQGYGKIF